MEAGGPLEEPGQQHEPRRLSTRTTPTEPATEPAPRWPASDVGRARRWRWSRLAIRLTLLLLVALLAQIVIYRFAAPSWTATMAVRWVLGEPVEQRWVPLERISPQLVRAVIVSEDARFCTHAGIDVGELKAAIEEALDGTSPRGASTITMQVVKNVLLWPGRSYVRKALELPLALLVDFAWPKRRILEVYLNIAEWGPGTYGIGAASLQAFGKPALALTADEAARLAVVLPNPAGRDPSDLEPRNARVSQLIAARMRASVNVGCVDRRPRAGGSRQITLRSFRAATSAGL